MPSRVAIDNDLLAEAMQLTGVTNAREAVEKALRMYLELHEQAKTYELQEKLALEGDLDVVRRD